MATSTSFRIVQPVQDFALDRTIWTSPDTTSLPLASRRLEKRRHLVPHGELTIEVDVYAGELTGLVLAEVEFPDEDAAGEFEPPAWLGRELTGDSRFASQRLAAEGKPRDATR